jgi:hypothetical protein
MASPGPAPAIYILGLLDVKTTRPTPERVELAAWTLHQEGSSRPKRTLTCVVGGASSMAGRWPLISRQRTGARSIAGSNR